MAQTIRRGPSGFEFFMGAYMFQSRQSTADQRHLAQGNRNRDETTSSSAVVSAVAEELAMSGA
jgi:hypothetical protein